ncbi:hypothetical protein CC85DRAFT_169465 [Cutaneotrichosporon oleaginosum]|uniref:Uncharacterized protein n=1 Tax=Cutaneotrichosporon oleaginosum TaxID=879819 RepID=A0A0J0XVC0_9TREE|nr:uncharacterized protein CC85DRAFT_169465 [Cutaneotrichosporon oleaginosum]KLT45007.1 hypothetical protein CC85DRAFT_169465 [Cutaneotrichosporon oleaginosum]TXT09695.1 hypothetical protein COLE_03629 [Cutaneotrichosporon oleaginosum]
MHTQHAHDFASSKASGTRSCIDSSGLLYLPSAWTFKVSVEILVHSFTAETPRHASSPLGRSSVHSRLTTARSVNSAAMLVENIQRGDAKCTDNHSYCSRHPLSCRLSHDQGMSGSHPVFPLFHPPHCSLRPLGQSPVSCPDTPVCRVAWFHALSLSLRA